MNINYYFKGVSTKNQNSSMVNIVVTGKSKYTLKIKIKEKTYHLKIKFYLAYFPLN